MKIGIGLLLLIYLNISLASSQDPELSVKVQQGEKATSFLVRKSGEKFLLSTRIPTEAPSERALTKKDFDYLVAKFNRLPVPKSIPAECARTRVDIQLKGVDQAAESKSSCFGVRTMTEPAYADFVKLLLILR